MDVKTIQRTETTSLLWLTDLHLDRANEQQRHELYESIRFSTAGAVVITGDISTAKLLPLHMRELAAAASPTPVYFVLGNHDFYGSSIAAVDSAASGVCRAHDNLHHLGQGELIPLNDQTAFIGHRGWGDGRMGWSARTLARNPDFQAIEDFRGLEQPKAFELLAQLGRESAAYFRRVLPYALTCYRHVIVATHVPPFTWAAHFKGKPCDWLRQPFDANISAGAAILRIAERFPASRVTVLSGHTHCAASVGITENLIVHAGGATTGHPAAQGLLQITREGLIRMREA